MSNGKAGEFFEQYWEHASALRSWFVAYGVGSLAVVITNKDLFNPKQNLQLFVFLIAAAVALQIILVFINKNAHYCVYVKGASP